MPYGCQYSAKEPKSTDYSAQLTFEAYEREIQQYDEIHERHRAARYAEAERRTRTELSLSSQLLLTNLIYLLGLPIITYQLYSPPYLPILFAISAYQSQLILLICLANVPIIVCLSAYQSYQPSLLTKIAYLLYFRTSTDSGQSESELKEFNKVKSEKMCFHFLSIFPFQGMNVYYLLSDQEQSFSTLVTHN